jgi:hypothetical protein
MGAFADALAVAAPDDSGGTGISIRPAGDGKKESPFAAALANRSTESVKPSSNKEKESSKYTPSWSDAITDIPSEIGKSASENLDLIKKGLTPSGQGTQGTFEHLANTGKGLLGVGGLIASPITGAARSLIGHPMAQAEHAVGTVIAPEIAARDNPQQMYETAKGDVDTAMSAMATRGAPVRAPIPARAPTQSDLIGSAASRLSDVSGVDVSVPRAIASDHMAVQRAGQAIRNIPIVGDAIPKATEGLVNNLGNAVQSVADQHGSGSGPNVANRISGRLSTAAEAEQRAAQGDALRSDAAVTGHWERAQTAANQSLNATDTNSLQAAQQAVGNMSPQEMGQNLIGRLRAGEQEARANKDRLYGIAGEGDASVRADSVQGVHNRVSTALDDMGRVVDPQLTPAASRMMGELQNFSELRIPNRVGAPPPDPAGVVAVDARGMEQTRKRLSGMSQAATNDADRAASRIIMRQFDEWQAHAYDNALFSGSPEALQAARDARAANTSWRQRFYNDRDDADRIVNRIATGEVTPQEVSNWVVGASQVGSKGVSSRLLTRIAEATNNDPETMQTIRGGVWNRLSQSANGVDAKAAPRIANDIGEFINGSGRDVANRLFTDQQRGIMQAYADTLRRTAVGREHVAQVAANTRPSPMEVGIGPMQELANDVLGRGGRSDEALFNAINAYAKSGGKGDIQTLSRLTQALPQQDKGDLASSIIRQLGVSPRTGQFSPDVFVSQWSTYTPQAKTLLFGNAGPQRTALDDIATISDRLKQVGSKFGNPSGTAQNVNFFALASGFVAAPLTTMSTAIGGWGVAKILSSPAGASSAAKWTQSYAALITRPSAQTIGAFHTASRNLTNTAQGFGLKVSVNDFLRALQSPSPTRADDQNSVPRPPSQ